MKFARFKYQGKTQYGVVTGQNLRTVSGNIFRNYSVGPVLCKLKDVELLTPVTPRNIVSIGLNYPEKLNSLTDLGLPIPKNPIIFIGAPSSVATLGADVVYPTHLSKDVRHCTEPVIVIGKKAYRVPESEAKQYIFGYTVGNDMAAKDLVVEDYDRPGRGHSFDNFRHFGPFISTDIDGDNVELISKVNGKVVGTRNTREMVFKVSTVIHIVSQCMTLIPGDLIYLGSGVGIPVNIGDVIEATIEEIGTLKNRIVAPRE